jgi:hypothetical protein
MWRISSARANCNSLSKVGTQNTMTKMIIGYPSLSRITTTGFANACESILIAEVKFVELLLKTYC